MVVHFENKADAKAHLVKNGWRLKAGGLVWISADATCRARIDALPNTPVVQLYAWEV